MTRIRCWRIDPGTNSVVATVSLPGVGAHAVATSPGVVWVATEGPQGTPGVVARIDAATNQVVATTAMPGISGVMDLAFAAGSVWAELDSGVARLDPSSLSVGPRIVLPRSSLSCGGLAADDSAVWVASGEGCFGCGGLSAGLARVDPSTNHVSTLSIGVPWDVAIGLGSVWTTDADRVLRRFNPSTGALEGTLSIPVTGASVVTVAGEGVWVGDANGRLLELAPT